MIYNKYYERYLFLLYCIWNFYLHTLQEINFYFGKKQFCCRYSYKSVKVLESPKILPKSWKIPGVLLQRVLEKAKKCSGESWKNLEFKSVFGGKRNFSRKSASYISWWSNSYSLIFFCPKKVSYILKKRSDLVHLLSS